ncbi:baseplate J/gp47 family protein [Camelimonas sp. ID_303_24]
MPFAIPSLLDKSRAVWGYIRARLPGADGEIWPNNLRIIGKVISMAVHDVDLRAEYLFRQIFTSTAERAYLDLHAYEVGLVRRPAAQATGNVIMAATPGVTFAAGIRLVRNDGVFFVTTAPATAVGNSVTLAVQAEDAGADGNTPAAAAMRVAASVPDLADSGEVGPAGLGAGADGELDDLLRGRILYRKRNRTRGGNDNDYKEWATEVPGIARAFVRGWMPGAGAVSVYPILTGSGSAAIPTVPDLEAVAAHIETKRPATATVYVLQATARVIDVSVHIRPDTTAIRAEVVAELQDMFDERAVVALPSDGDRFDVEWISAAIQSAIGLDSHDLIAPAADIMLTTGQYPVLGSVTWMP